MLKTAEIKTVIMILFASISNSLANRDIKPQPVIETFVSIESKAGDIRLVLKEAKQFTITISYWDDASKSHTGEDSLAGKWKKNGNDLILMFDNKNIAEYEAGKTELKAGDFEAEIFTYKFKKSKAKYFGRGIDLLMKQNVDQMLIQAIPLDEKVDTVQSGKN